MDNCTHLIAALDAGQAQVKLMQDQSQDQLLQLRGAIQSLSLANLDALISQNKTSHAYQELLAEKRQRLGAKKQN